MKSNENKKTLRIFLLVTVRMLLILILLFAIAILASLALNEKITWLQLALGYGILSLIIWFLYRKTKQLWSEDPNVKLDGSTPDNEDDYAKDDDDYYIPPFVWVLIGIIVVAVLLIVFGLFTVDLDDWWIPVYLILIYLAVSTVIRLARSYRVLHAITAGALFILAGFVIWYVGLKWKPWDKNYNDTVYPITTTIPYSNATDTLAIQAAQKLPIEPPGPGLFWGENEVKAGVLYRLDRQAKFYTTLVYPKWNGRQALHYVRVDNPGDTTLYQTTPYRSDGSSYIDPTTGYRDDREAVGLFYFYPTEDMVIMIRKL